MTALKINPRIPQLLGYAGLLPMLALLFGIWGWPQLTTQLTDAATLYVGVIFSFLGGLQWGLAVRGDMENPPDTNATLRLIVGVAPSLTTGCALLIPTLYGGVCLITGLWLLLAFEWHWRDNNELPNWYLPLRITLTIMLSGSLAAVLWLAG